MRICLLLLAVHLYSSRASAQMDDKFYFPSKTLKAVDSLTFEEVILPVDSVQVSGLFLKPAGKPKATVLFFHGAGGNVTSYLFMTRPLVQNGYQVFMVDFRGYGKSTGKPTHLNIAKDGQLVLEYLLQRKEVKNTKVVLYGASMGTQVATRLAQQNQDKVAALVLEGTISSFTDIAADSSPEAQRDMIRQHLPSPYAAKEDIKSIAGMPKLFIHSKEDKDVPFHQGEEVFKAAQAPKEFFVFEGKHLEGMKWQPAAILQRLDAMVRP